MIYNISNRGLNEWFVILTKSFDGFEGRKYFLSIKQDRYGKNRKGQTRIERERVNQMN